MQPGGRPNLLHGLARRELLVVKQLLEDAHADQLFRGVHGLAEKIGLRTEGVRDSLDTLETRGIIRRWRDLSRTQRVISVEIVPIGHKLRVPERRGGKNVSRETVFNHWIPRERT